VENKNGSVSVVDVRRVGRRWPVGLASFGAGGWGVVDRFFLRNFLGIL